MIIFFGDSITRDWPLAEVVPGGGALNAGIGGDTTARMRARFAADVLARRPAMLHLLAGINDIGQNEGFVPVPDMAARIESMVAEARAQGIGVVLGLVAPCTIFEKRSHIVPGPAVRALNERLRVIAEASGVVLADYFTPLAEGDALRPSCTEDGLHPNATGYALMSPVARAALAVLRGGSA